MTLRRSALALACLGLFGSARADTFRPECFAPAPDTGTIEHETRQGPYKLAFVNGFAGNDWRIQAIQSAKAWAARPENAANIDEFTETTAKALEVVGGAALGKAIIVLNPADPPLIMRNTVFCLTQTGEPEAFRQAIGEMVDRVQQYVPGYRLKQQVQVDQIADSDPIRIPQLDRKFTGWKISVFLEVEGAGHYLPPYAGNLDIMTSAALKTAEQIAARVSP